MFGQMTTADFHPRNALVTIKRLPRDDQKVGAIHMPANSGEFDTALVVGVGPGTAGDNGRRMCDTDDLHGGMKVLIRAEKHIEGPQGQRVRQTHTLKFNVADEELEVLNQVDIVAILKDDTSVSYVRGS